MDDIDNFSLFDPWIGSSFVVTDSLGNHWLPFPILDPNDPNPETQWHGAREWSTADPDAANFSFVNVGELTCGPSFMIGPVMFDDETLQNFQEDPTLASGVMRDIDPADKHLLGEDELLLEIGDVCCAVTAEEHDCAVVSFDDGIMVFMDIDGDGVIDHVDNVSFDGTRNSWRIPKKND